MRNVISLNKNWAFIQENAGLPGEMPTDWHKVDLPHTWNAVDGHDGNGSYDRGTYWYAKTFETPKQPLGGGKVYVEILAAGQQATVYVNGKEVTYHEGGYSTFRADITDVCHEKGDNLLVIACSNEMKDSVYPQSADFTFYGGLYRGVNLISVPDAHFDLEYYGGPGIQVTPKPCECGGAAFEIVSYVKETDENFTVLYAICDAEGNEVASACRPADETTVTVYVPDAKLWEIDAPYLYTVTAKLQRRNETYDEISARVGVRSFSCDPNKGFIINGAETPLRGVSRHQDMLYKGNALTKEDHYEDARLIKELGANTIRLAHYQHSQDFYDACDEMGFVVWAEIPFISVMNQDPDAHQNCIIQLKELIIQNYHHASIVTWGSSNEITIKDKNRADMLDNHHMLNDLVHELDPSRPTTLACYAMCMPTHKVVHITDLVGYNLYLGWYVPFPWLNDLFLKGFHKIWPKRPLCYSEYGAEGMPNLHSEHPKRGDHTEEYQAVYHEYMLECFKRHPFMWGTYVWNMFDFAADARDQGGEPGMNHKGLITFDRKIKKDSFYLYKAYWSEEAFVYICGRRYVDRTQKKSKIKVYSNCSNVALYQNGKLAEEKQGAHIFEFSVVLEKENTFEVRTKEGCTDQIQVRLVETPNLAYKLKKTKSKNWV